MIFAEKVLEKVRAASILFRGEAGQDMTEYALLAAFISPIVISAIILIGPDLNHYFQDVINALAR